MELRKGLLVTNQSMIRRTEEERDRLQDKLRSAQIQVREMERQLTTLEGMAHEGRNASSTKGRGRLRRFFRCCTWKELRRVNNTHSMEEIERRNMGTELDRRNKEVDELKSQVHRYIDEVRRIEELLQAKVFLKKRITSTSYQNSININHFKSFYSGR